MNVLLLSVMSNSFTPFWLTFNISCFWTHYLPDPHQVHHDDPVSEAQSGRATCSVRIMMKLNPNRAIRGKWPCPEPP